MQARLSWLGIAAFVLAGCHGQEVADAPALVSSAGIPSGAPGAFGVRFGPNGMPGGEDPSIPNADGTDGTPHLPHGPTPHALPKNIPDPFNPHEPTAPPKKKGTTL